MLRAEDVAVIILNYKGSRDTIACLQALRNLTNPPGAIIVVDNASPDGSVKLIKDAWQQWADPQLVRSDTITQHIGTDNTSHALLLLLEKNDGYASGNNAGIRLAQMLPHCSAYWVINNDTEPNPHALDALCARYNSTKGPALVGSTLVFAANPTRVQCAAGGTVTAWLGITMSICGGMDLSHVLSLPISTVEKQLGYITGASLLIDQDTIRQIGSIREDFFLYMEDTDFGIRARKAGIPLLWAQKSIVFHKEGGSTGASSANNVLFQRPRWIDYLLLRNRARLVFDHYKLGIPLLCISYIGVAGKRILRKQLHHVPMVFKALWHGLIGKMGKPHT